MTAQEGSTTSKVKSVNLSLIMLLLARKATKKILKKTLGGGGKKAGNSRNLIEV